MEDDEKPVAHLAVVTSMTVRADVVEEKGDCLLARGQCIRCDVTETRKHKKSHCCKNVSTRQIGILQCILQHVIVAQDLLARCFRRIDRSQQQPHATLHADFDPLRAHESHMIGGSIADGHRCTIKS